MASARLLRRMATPLRAMWIGGFWHIHPTSGGRRWADMSAEEEQQFEDNLHNHESLDPMTPPGDGAGDDRVAGDATDHILPAPPPTLKATLSGASADFAERRPHSDDHGAPPAGSYSKGVQWVTLRRTRYVQPYYTREAPYLDYLLECGATELSSEDEDDLYRENNLGNPQWFDRRAWGSSESDPGDGREEEGALFGGDWNTILRGASSASPVSSGRAGGENSTGAGDQSEDPLSGADSTAAADGQRQSPSGAEKRNRHGKSRRLANEVGGKGNAGESGGNFARRKNKAERLERLARQPVPPGRVCSWNVQASSTSNPTPPSAEEPPHCYYEDAVRPFAAAAKKCAGGGAGAEGKHKNKIEKGRRMMVNHLNAKSSRASEDNCVPVPTTSSTSRPQTETSANAPSPQTPPATQTSAQLCVGFAPSAGGAPWVALPVAVPVTLVPVSLAPEATAPAPIFRSARSSAFPEHRDEVVVPGVVVDHHAAGFPARPASSSDPEGTQAQAHRGHLQAAEEMEDRGERSAQQAQRGYGGLSLSSGGGRQNQEGPPESARPVIQLDKLPGLPDESPESSSRKWKPRRGHHASGGLTMTSRPPSRPTAPRTSGEVQTESMIPPTEVRSDESDDAQDRLERYWGEPEARELESFKEEMLQKQHHSRRPDVAEEAWRTGFRWLLPPRWNRRIDAFELHHQRRKNSWRKNPRVQAVLSKIKGMREEKPLGLSDWRPVEALVGLAKGLLFQCRKLSLSRGSAVGGRGFVGGGTGENSTAHSSTTRSGLRTGTGRSREEPAESPSGARDILKEAIYTDATMALVIVHLREFRDTHWGREVGSPAYNHLTKVLDELGRCVRVFLTEKEARQNEKSVSP